MRAFINVNHEKLTELRKRNMKKKAVASAQERPGYLQPVSRTASQRSWRGIQYERTL